MEKNYVIVLITAANREEAEKISNALLNERLIACANIIGPIHSLFWWHEKIEKSEEYMLLMKTCSEMFEKITEKVKALHSYEIPEIIAIPIIKGFKLYLEWLNNSLR